MPTLPAYAQWLEVENRRLQAALKEIAERPATGDAPITTPPGDQPVPEDTK